MAWVLLATTIFGINLGIWILVGLLRFSSGRVRMGFGVLRRGGCGPPEHGRVSKACGMRVGWR